ncbi:hypothetical protein, partial [Streptomyces sp. NPDC048473]|uniref:hypothetical protein n=1 Tax=unclassified Streptomyces TaxID=2593676 RepID=UPI0037197F60
MQDDLGLREEGRRLWPWVEAQAVSALVSEWTGRPEMAASLARLREAGRLSDVDRRDIAGLLGRRGEWDSVAGDVAPVVAAEVFGLSLRVLNVTASSTGVLQIGQSGADRRTVFLVRTEGDFGGGHWMAARPDTDALLTSRGSHPVTRRERVALADRLPGATARERAVVIAGDRLLASYGRAGTRAHLLLRAPLLRDAFIPGTFAQESFFTQGNATLLAAYLNGQASSSLAGALAPWVSSVNPRHNVPPGIDPFQAAYYKGQETSSLAGALGPQVHMRPAPRYPAVDSG